MHLDMQLSNFSQWRSDFHFGVELDADFADLGYYTVAPGMLVASSWDNDNSTVFFNARAEHHFHYPGYEGDALFQRSCMIQSCHSSEKPERTAYGIGFQIGLNPAESWSSCLNISCKDRGVVHRAPAHGSVAKQVDGTEVTVPSTFAHGQVLMQAFRRSEHDLVALEMGTTDSEPANTEESNSVVIAGIPKYTSLFGRDCLKSSWQSSLVGFDRMKDSLRALAAYQGTEWNDWTDERPGRMPHEIQTGPLSALRYKPSFRNYGTVTASAVFCIVLTEMWRWSGDEALAKKLLPNAMKAMADIDKYDELKDTGIYGYQTRSPQGVRNQGWKDSPGAIVYPDGSQVEPPIATCEQQGYVYRAKLNLAELLDWFGHKTEASRLRKQAYELKQRFNERFWMTDENYFALGLDPELEQIGSVASDPGHCLATGIVDESLAPLVVQKLMSPQLFSGWGIRTLSTDNPAYNPWSYHRGSVWPVEQATFSLGFKRYDQRQSALKLIEAQLDALQLFPHSRFPELFSGHKRDDEHPFPGIYPEACWPQAWSASAPVMLLHVLLGTYAYAPKHQLYVDPCLPEWLPEIVMRKLRIGTAIVSLRIHQTADGCKVDVLDLEGKLQVIHKPLVWADITSIDGVNAA
jgi:glycogen debranching enzyme